MHLAPTHLRKPPLRAFRQLQIEPLEARRVLSADLPLDPAEQADAEGTPWQNPVYRLDVNNDGATRPSDVLVIINRILTGGAGALPEPPPGGPEFFYDTSGDNRVTPFDLLHVINGLLAPPVVEVSSLTAVTADTTPVVTVTVSDNAEIPNDTPVELDVDLNNDGDFADPGERGHTQSTLFAGSSTFPITPALPRTGTLDKITLRARVKDTDAVSGASDRTALTIDTRTSDVLANYVNAPDDSFEWELNRSEAGTGWTTYFIDMTSQTWRSPAEVDRTVWTHEVEIFVPDVLSHSTAHLLVDVPAETTTGPVNLGQFAALTESIVVHVPSVPNQPLTFSDDNVRRREDRLLAYTFDKFMENLGQPGNETWPALLPMVKSIVRGMDVVQQFVPTVGGQIDGFLLSGYSKRGWTVWLTAAVDQRVRAIMPGVYDLLNIAPQMVHHYGVLGRFYDAWHDYEDMQIVDRMLTDAARQLWTILDPYRFLNNGRFDDMPKLLLNGTGDEFFQPDSSQFYIHDLPGNKNYLRYFPNGNHGLGIDEDPTELLASTVGFQIAVMNNLPMPEYSWTAEQDGSIRVQAATPPVKVKLWQATTTNRDFRIRKNLEAVWTATTLVDQGGGTYVGNVPMPQAGATAYLVELTFDGLGMVFTTEVRVKSTLPFNLWPFESDPAPAGPAPAALAVAEPAAASAEHQPFAVRLALASRNETASARAIESTSNEIPAETAAIDALWPTPGPAAAAAAPVNPPLLPPAEPAHNEPLGERPGEASESVLAFALDEVLGEL